MNDALPANRHFAGKSEYEERRKPAPDVDSVWSEYAKGLKFNDMTGFNETVRTNENFFIGRQWEGVEPNGLPTPVFNFLKRVVLFTVSSITSNSLKIQASAMADMDCSGSVEVLSDVVNAEFEKLFETNKINALIREYTRNAAVDGDGCLYTYWDPDAETGQAAKGAAVTEVIENTRVFFGNQSERRVQKQPYIIIMSREMVDDVRERARRNGCAEWGEIRADSDDRKTDNTNDMDDKVTVLLRLWKDKKAGTVRACECSKNTMIRGPWDTGLTLYPLTWLNWDYVQDNYHGMAMITGLIPNQIFVNKLYAMSMISLMTTAYPKIVYDRTRIAKWDNRVGAAIPVQGGDVGSVAKIIDPAQISPQIAQFIELAVNDTQTFLGATSAALGDVKPENTSAIIALQKASAVPNEITKQNLCESIENLGRIYLDFMAAYYGVQTVETDLGPDSPTDIGSSGKTVIIFDFSVLRKTRFTLRLDVGASSYWSEIASMQTLDNLLTRGKLDLTDYLERIPDGYIAGRQELLDKLRREKNRGGIRPFTDDLPKEQTSGEL